MDEPTVIIATIGRNPQRLKGREKILEYLEGLPVNDELISMHFNDGRNSKYGVRAQFIMAARSGELYR